MLTVRKPNAELMRRYLDVQTKLPFSYAEVGATATTLPPNYAVDHTRIDLGEGEASFEAAKQALTQWKQFALGWLETWPAATPVREGETLAVLVRVLGLWWLNAAQIVYVVDESTDSAARFGFAYGTLPGHVEAGEERFLVEWDHATGTVRYDILAFSRPRHFLTRIGRRRVRRMQRRFGQESAAAMRRAVAQAVE